MGIQDDNIVWLALDVILFALHDLRSMDANLRESARVFFEGDPEESTYRFWLEILHVDVTEGLPTPEDVTKLISEAGYKSPLDARASKLHQLSKYPKPCK